MASTAAFLLVGAIPALAAEAAGDPVTREYERYADSFPVPTYAGSAAPAASIPMAPSLAVPPATAVFPGATAGEVQVAQLAGRDAATQSNPFRASSAPTLDEPTAAGTIGAPGSAAPTVTDPLTADIDRSIRQLSNDMAPQLNASVSLRGRSGDEGLAQLFDIETPVEASFSPAGEGRFKVVVTPTVLLSGHTDSGNARLFGTNPLLPAKSPVSTGHSTVAAGSALDVGYAWGIVSADIGTTPLGFRETNIVGGVQVLPRLGSNLALRVAGERRAVNDSILSFAGVRDPQTGLSWGGVTRNRGHAQLEGSVGTVNYYAGAGIAGLYGHNVQDNFEVEAGAGFNLPVYTTATQEVRTGLDLVYFGYTRNLGNFTFGNGGYFSPQQFFAAIVPVTYRQQLTPDLVYSVGASLGVQTFRAKSTRVFPNDPAFQAQLAATAGAATQLAGFSDVGPTGGVNGEVDYRVNDNLHVGAKAGFDRSGNFTEGTGLLYARYVFNNAM